MKNYLNKLLAKKKAKKGFTLVELLVVIAILAILATVSVVGYLGFTTDAKKSNDLTELAQYKTLVLAKVVDGSEDVTVSDVPYHFTYGKVEATNEYKMTISEEIVYTKCADNAIADKAYTVADAKYFTKNGDTYTAVDVAANGSLADLYTSNGANGKVSAAEAAKAIESIIGKSNVIDGSTLSVTGDSDTEMTIVKVINYRHNITEAGKNATWTIATDGLKQAD